MNCTHTHATCTHTRGSIRTNAFLWIDQNQSMPSCTLITLPNAFIGINNTKKCIFGINNIHLLPIGNDINGKEKERLFY